jgi:pimeloyl-ACP methyl ester carboxylesterase
MAAEPNKIRPPEKAVRAPRASACMPSYQWSRQLAALPFSRSYGAHKFLRAKGSATLKADARTATDGMLGTADLRAALPRLKMPTAIVVGEEDYATPLAMAQALHRGIAGSTLTVLPGARHLTPLEQPDQIAAELRRLMGSAR